MHIKEKLESMEIGKSMKVDFYIVTRVHGGWIYKCDEEAGSYDGGVAVATVFIPFCKDDGPSKI